MWGERIGKRQYPHLLVAEDGVEELAEGVPHGWKFFLVVVDRPRGLVTKSRKASSE